MEKPSSVDRTLVASWPYNYYSARICAYRNKDKVSFEGKTFIVYCSDEIWFFPEQIIVD
jgi:hypothetical protein